MEIVKTSKGGDMLLYQGYSYVRKNTKNVSIRWACVKSRSTACHGAVTTDELPIANPRRMKVHNHVSSDSAIEVSRCRSELREASRTYNFIGTSALVAASLQTLSPQAVADVGNVETLRRDVQRQKAKHRPAEPNTLVDINIQPPWTTTGGLHPVPFLFFDSGRQDPNRMLIFGTDDCLTHLSAATEWYMDGNFKLSPSIFKQLYVIRAKLDNGAISCVYALLTGKDGQLYNEMFTVILQKCNALGLNPAPTSINVDFEMAVFNCIRNMFGNAVDINACFYHLCQSTWRHVQDFGLTAMYMANANVKEFIGMMDGLAFLPIADIDAGVLLLRNIIPNALLLPVLEYFLRTYVGVWELGLNGLLVHRPPLFAQNTWNVFTITLNGGARTNNVCEGWNNSFKVLVGQQHPPLYKLIESLQKDNAIVRTQMSRSINGMPFSTQVRRNYTISQNNLQRACQGYQRGQYANDFGGYLRRISYHIRFDV